MCYVPAWVRLLYEEIGTYMNLISKRRKLLVKVVGLREMMLSKFAEGKAESPPTLSPHLATKESSLKTKMRLRMNMSSIRQNYGHEVPDHN